MFRSLFALLLVASQVRSEVRVFPNPGLPPSQNFKVEVFTADGWRESYVNSNKSRTSGLGANDQPGRSTSWTTFRCDSEVRLRITRLSGPFEKALIRPSRHGISPQIKNDQTIEFKVHPGQKISVEFDSDIKENCFTGPPHGIDCVIDSLLIFADQIPKENPLDQYAEKEIQALRPGRHSKSLPIENLPNQTAELAIPNLSNSKRVIHFLPGVHHLGYWQVPNSVDHIHFSSGAFVYGAIDVLPKGCQPGKMDLKKIYLETWFKQELRQNFRITGPGILCGSHLPWHLTKDFSYAEKDVYWSHIKLLQLAVQNITLTDLTLVDSPYWVLSFINDTDHRSCGTFDNFKMLGAWTYNNDGLPVPGGEKSQVRNAFIHANDDAFKLYNSDARIENCVIWQGPNGASFQLGWFPKSIENVRVSDVDIIHHENWYGVNQTNRAVINFADASGKGLIEDFRFNQLRVEGPILRLFDLSPGEGQRITNFHFKDLKVDSLDAGQPGKRGRNHFTGDVANFHFENFTIGESSIMTTKQAGFLLSQGSGSDFTFKP